MYYNIILTKISIKFNRFFLKFGNFVIGRTLNLSIDGIYPNVTPASDCAHAAGLLVNAWCT